VLKPRYNITPVGGVTVWRLLMIISKVYMTVSFMALVHVLLTGAHLVAHQVGFFTCISLWGAPCGLWGCKNGPAPFPGRMSYKAT